MTTTARDVASELAAIVGDANVLAGAIATMLYARDASVQDDGDCGLVVVPATTHEVAACMRVAAAAGLDVVPRGSGTGLTGGAVPLGGALVISLTRMNQIVEIDGANSCAWVEPGVLNLDISTAVAPLGLFYAPDPSSQQACSIGGNVATNAGGPHCLAYGVTNQHILGMEMVLADGEVLVLGGPAPDPPGYDLRGVVVGSEGMVGVVTRICVRLTPEPPAVQTMLLDFPTVADAAEVVQEIIAAGVVPAALEMMDRNMVRIIEPFVHAGLPVDAAAVLLVEVDGTDADVAMATGVVQRVARANHVGGVRVAHDEDERALLWKARKSAFGACARVKPIGAPARTPRGSASVLISHVSLMAGGTPAERWCRMLRRIRLGETPRRRMVAPCGLVARVVSAYAVPERIPREARTQISPNIGHIGAAKGRRIAMGRSRELPRDL